MPETIGVRLERAAKDKKNLTLAQFAGQLGVSYETARKWVVGSTAPNRNRLEKICRLLDVTPEWVMFGDSMPSAAGTTTSIGSATLTVGAPIPAAPSATATVQNLADLLRAMPLAQREGIARELSLLAQVPDSAALPRSIAAALDGSATNRRASDQAARIEAAAQASEVHPTVAPPGTSAMPERHETVGGEVRATLLGPKGITVRSSANKKNAKGST